MKGDECTFLFSIPCRAIEVLNLLFNFQLYKSLHVSILIIAIARLICARERCEGTLNEVFSVLSCHSPLQKIAYRLVVHGYPIVVVYNNV